MELLLFKNFLVTIQGNEQCDGFNSRHSKQETVFVCI